MKMMEAPAGPVYPSIPPEFLPPAAALQALTSHICEEDQPLLLDVLAELFTEAAQHLLEGRPNCRWVVLLPFEQQQATEELTSSLPQVDGVCLRKNHSLEEVNECFAILQTYLSELLADLFMNVCHESEIVRDWLKDQPLELLTCAKEPRRGYFVHLTKSSTNNINASGNSSVATNGSHIVHHGSYNPGGVINGSGTVSDTVTGGGSNQHNPSSYNININFTIVAGVLLLGGSLLGLYVALRHNVQHAPAENVTVSPTLSWFSRK